MATARSLALTALAGVFLFAGCVTGGQLRATAGVVQENLKLARKQGAMKCAPRQLARGEAHLTFALGELDQGDWQRAQQELDLAQTSTRKAVRLSRGCIKQVLIKKPKPPPVIVKIKEKDTDGDGIPDNKDKCPKQPGPKSNQGCPVVKPKDTDGDGLTDDVDRCPKVPGPASNQGCPPAEAPLDTDGDGIPDTADKCPKQAGPASNHGCPILDSDGDGIPDNVDKCPNEPEDKDGFQDQDGCPDLDNDQDGIPDVKDKCPDQKGPPETNGCPPKDSDGDGVPDYQDKCPQTPGLKELQGCPRKYKLVTLTKKKIEIKQKVHFATGRYRILSDSFELLNEVAQVLKDNPKITLRIEGHTDSRGSDSFNLRLSQKRARSVRRYLIGQGVDPGRLKAVGFGETRPIATNATRAGREANRRVEFVITSQ